MGRGLCTELALLVTVVIIICHLVGGDLCKFFLVALGPC